MPAALAAAFLALAAAAPARAAKTDVVVMLNGDRITCELKYLQRGKLEVKTDGLGTIDVEWNRVRSVASLGLFEVEDLRGRLYFGSLQPSLEEGKLDVVGLSSTRSVDVALVVRIQQLRRSFWMRLSGSLDVGFSYTASSELTQFQLAGSLQYRRPTFQLRLDANSLVTSQPDAPETQRNSAEFGYIRFRESRQLAFGQVRLEQNRELGYELRSNLRGGYGSYFVRSQGNELLGGLGLNVNHEVPVEGDSKDNLEGLIALSWQNYSFAFPKTDVSVQLAAFPSFSEWGRWRMDLEARIKREIFRDFTLSLNGYDSYDSRPATEGASKNDWGVSLAVGFTFH
jgi:putative salt-induced outer membrane protein YdiY